VADHKTGKKESLRENRVQTENDFPAWTSAEQNDGTHLDEKEVKQIALQKRPTVSSS
jgi:hypothetical protein